MDLIYRFDPRHPVDRLRPASAREALDILEAGNRGFCDLVDRARLQSDAAEATVIPCDARLLGVAAEGAAPAQEPFGVLVGCADARVPPQMIFQRMSNELFVVRVAGNVIGDDVLASVEYAFEHLREGLRVAVVLGHTGCGAVTAAVDVYLRPLRFSEIGATRSVRALVYRLLLPVRAAARALEVVWGADVVDNPGYRTALVETAVCLNAGETAFQLRRELRVAGGDDFDVAFGVYDLATNRVGLPGPEDVDATSGLTLAPIAPEDLVPLSETVSRSRAIRSLLGAS